MSIKYDPASYEMPWRRNYELMQAAVWLLGAVGYLAYSVVSDFPCGPILWIAGGMSILGGLKLKKGMRLLRMQTRLAGSRLPVCTFDDLRLKFKDSSHHDELWLGMGFLWGTTHTQRVMDILCRDWQGIVKDALGPFYVWRFIVKNRSLVLQHPLMARRRYYEQEKSLQEKGQRWIHGVGDKDADIYQPLSHTEGHTLVIGTTGSGKTRCFDLLISQAILRGECVIIIDPKGDNDLKEKARRACEQLGRKDSFVMFHPAKTDESAHINLLANWTRPTELASRIANLIQSSGGQSDPFKNFSWDALNKVAQGLCLAYEKPSIMNLRRYLESSPEELCEKAFTKHILQAYGEAGEKIIEKLFSSCKRNYIEQRVTALVNYYLQHGPNDPALDGLISLRNHDKEHFGKMVTSLLPILSQLTSGKLGQLLSPPDDEDVKATTIFRDTGDFIDKNAVVYMGLDSLSDNMVGSAIGSLMLSDLTAAAGAIYNFKEKHRVVNVFVDEAAECVNDSFIQLLNKGRGARFRLVVATQTISDFAARLGSMDKAMQVVGNLNNIISLRCIDDKTQEFVTKRFPKTKVKSIAVDQGLSTDSEHALPKGGRLGERLTEEEVDLFPSQLLGMLPDLEFVAHLSGGKIVKGRYPFLVQDMSEIRSS